MERVRTYLRDFAAAEQGATAIEYGLIAGLISIVIVTGATLIGQSVIDFFTKAAAGFKS